MKMIFEHNYDLTFVNKVHVKNGCTLHIYIYIQKIKDSHAWVLDYI